MGFGLLCVTRLAQVGGIVGSPVRVLSGKLFVKGLLTGGSSSADGTRTVWFEEAPQLRRWRSLPAEGRSRGPPLSQSPQDPDRLSRDAPNQPSSEDASTKKRHHRFSALGQAEVRQKQPRKRWGQERGAGVAVLGRGRQKANGHGAAELRRETWHEDFR